MVAVFGLGVKCTLTLFEILHGVTRSDLVTLVEALVKLGAYFLRRILSGPALQLREIFVNN